MNLRLKTYIIILVLSLIAVLIARMYVELISSVINYEHPVTSVTANPPLSGKGKGEANMQSEPTKTFSLFTKGSFSSGLYYLPSQTADLALYPFPAASSTVP